MTARRRVLFLLNSLGSGGAERHAISLVNALDPERFEISVAYLSRAEALLPLVDRSRVRKLWCCDVTRKVDLAAARDLATSLDELEIDVVLCTNPYSALYGWLASRKARRRPRLIEVYHSRFLLTRKERLQMLLYKRILRGFDLLVYVCRDQLDYWRSQGLRAREDTVIYNGIDLEHFTDRFTATEKAALRLRHSVPPDRLLVGICGALRPEKQHLDFIAALALLRDAGVAASGLIIGDGPERARIESAIAERGLADHVAITGFMPDVRLAVASCDVITLTSHQETFSLAALEAMALGRPVVMTDVGGAREQIDPGISGYLYPAGDVAALAGHLKTLTAADLRARLGAAASESVRSRYGLAGMVDAFASRMWGPAAS